ncbi:MAG: tricarballylate utilization 4Fe-4S protein TcuB [Gammaproteobacteria bacterium]|nr:tricarballylate utilization 4Fe-4S protein TcuB [Gammaproteobacteria bacterium]MBU1603376.1 tricarballylate utilization 4Fe-4S protein TcuB [Gammaproteobacteria bacterium]MBU2432896.1 tricarballylate utilization 4Fe-4S protein TcuB [Gammaproteobacteria bacterium]MBU2450139.1 tricarballylate utilization 4Fe-4S protein TcuB [Gammaproteobacteria bacterium]
MQALEKLLGEARDLAARELSPSENEAEVGRIMSICNACRYCEGFCAVFPAMTRRLEFAQADIHYLANLCHNCGACLHACQYAPPHEFTVNVPRAMARVRGETYSSYAWPRALGSLYKNNGLTVALALALSLALFLLLTVQVTGGVLHEPLAGNFFAIFPHNTLALMFGAVFGYAILALSIGVRRFWGEVSPGEISGESSAEAASNVLRLKYLDGGHGQGCNNEDDAYTLLRRRFHHFTFYGFMLCFAATSVATLYHYLLDLHAPYALSSLPVMLGIAGGIGLLIGPAGLLWLNLKRHPLHGDAAQKPMDRGFIALLLLTSLTGLLLLALRDTSVMGLLLAIHLGVVMALFLTLPYGKFAHGIFRSAALLKWSIEKRQPSRLQLGSE